MESNFLQYLSYTDDREMVLNHLMTEYGQDVWNFVFFITKRSDVADDLSQEVFIRAYQHLSSFRGQSSVKTWLLTIARHQSINYIRSSYVKKMTFVDYWNTSKQTMPSAENVLFDQWETKRIWTCVMELPRKYREPLILSAHYQMPVEEIAQMLGVPAGTVKSRMSRARDKVSKCLAFCDEPKDVK